MLVWAPKMEANRPPIFLFTDGAASGNPGPGGFGVVERRGKAPCFCFVFGIMRDEGSKLENGERKGVLA